MTNICPFWPNGFSWLQQFAKNSVPTLDHLQIGFSSLKKKGFYSWETALFASKSKESYNTTFFLAYIPPFCFFENIPFFLTYREKYSFFHLFWNNSLIVTEDLWEKHFFLFVLVGFWFDCLFIISSFTFHFLSYSFDFHLLWQYSRLYIYIYIYKVLHFGDIFNILPIFVSYIYIYIHFIIFFTFTSLFLIALFVLVAFFFIFFVFSILLHIFNQYLFLLFMLSM